MVDALLEDHALSDAFDAILRHVRPDTDDAGHLDTISKEQLGWFTYRSGRPLTEMSDGNRLVPEPVTVSDGEEYPGQWFPFNQRVTLLIPEENLSEASVDVTVRGFQPAAVQYRTIRGVGWEAARERIGDRLEGGEIGDEPLEIAGDGAPKRTAAPAVDFVYKVNNLDLSDLPTVIDIDVSAQDSVLRYYNLDSDTVETTTIDRLGRTDDDLDPDWGRSIAIEYQRRELSLEFEIEVLDNAPAGYVRLTAELRNITDVDPDDYTAKLLTTVLNPVFSLTFEETKPVFPEQQHTEVLRREFGQSEPDETVEQLRQDDHQLYTQRHAILTRSVQDEQKYLVTQWGVYDFVEQKSPAANRVDIGRLATDTEYLFEHLTELNDAERDALEAHDTLVSNIQAVLRAVPEGLGIETSLYSVQWTAIQERIRMLLNNNNGSLVVRAPTSAGKTAVYFISSALVVLERDTRAFLPFPTTTLTDGMLERLIDFVAALRADGGLDLSCGVLMGKDTDPSEYRLERNEPVYLDAAEFTDYIDCCHECGADSLSVHRECAKCGGDVEENWTDNGHHQFACQNIDCRSTGARHYLDCTNCQNDYQFVYDHDGTVRYLPDFVVGTPDKLYSMATIQAYSEHSTYSPLPFFGAPFSRCEDCDRVLTDMNGYSAQNGRTDLRCDACSTWTDAGWNFETDATENATYDPIGHFVLDETHMYTGEFGAGVSVMVAFFRVLATRFRAPGEGGTVEHDISVDAGTATTGNALEHIQRLIRDESPVIVPEDGQFGEHFQAVPDSVRYRVLALKPVGTTNRNSFRRAMVRMYDRLDGSDFENDLQEAVTDSASDLDIDRLKLLLGYVFRRSEGYALKETIQDYLLRETGVNLDIPFMSGDMTKAQRRRLIANAEHLDTRMLLANMVVSLGLDIENLNNMILYGACRSTAEQIQAVGRTGRGEAGGHATIHLFPNRSRDAHLYNRFHGMLANIDDYVEDAIIRPTNPHVADRHMYSILSPLLTIQMTYVGAHHSHTVGDLTDLLDRMDNVERVIDHPNEYDESDDSAMHLRLLEDIRTVFAPDEMNLPEPFKATIYGRIITMYVDLLERENDLTYNSSSSIKLNEWLQQHILEDGGGGLRGNNDERVDIELTTQYRGTPQ